MNYIEFKNKYNYMTEHFPQTGNLYGFSDTELGKVTTTKYAKHGSRYVLTEKKTEEFTGRFYCNTVDAIPFFKLLGGKESVTKGWTTHFGNIPLKITSTSPNGESRTVREFKFY